MDISSFSHFSLLYIEDDASIREVNLRTLQRMFHAVYTASNGEEGLKAYKTHRPDIIVTDLKMPVMDGLSMVKEIRKSDNETKIIITTAFTNEQQLIDAIELNIVRYVVKPLSQRNLLPALEKATKELENIKKIQFNEDIYLNIQKNTLVIKDEEHRLTKKEFLFLELLGKNRNKTIKYGQIQANVWQDKNMSLHSLRTMVGAIKKKFFMENCIRNVSGIGYILEMN